MLVKSLSLAAICAASIAWPARAHHSHGNYDVTKWTMEGAVKELHLLVPHSWLYVEVKDTKGEATTWALEATGPRALKVGIERDHVKPGDRVKADATSQGRLQRLPARVYQGQGWIRQGLGRQ